MGPLGFCYYQKSDGPIYTYIYILRPLNQNTSTVEVTHEMDQI